MLVGGGEKGGLFQWVNIDCRFIDIRARERTVGVEEWREADR